MGLKETFKDAVVKHPREAHSHFTVVDPDNWSVYPSGITDSAKMHKAGWEGPFTYSADGVEYEAFGKSSAIKDSMRVFLDDWGVDDSSTVKITCPSCRETLELPAEAEGRRCSCFKCGCRFLVKGGRPLLQESKSENKPLRAILVDESGTDQREMATFFQLEKIRKSKDLFKYWSLFSLAPTSIKVATVFVLLQVVVDILFTVEPSNGRNYNYCFECATIFIFSGILKGYNTSRWLLFALRGFVLVATPFLYFGASGVKSDMLAKLYVETFGACVATLLTSLPYLIALCMPSANKWFKGYVADEKKLDKAVKDNVNPQPFGKVVLGAVIIVLTLVGLIVGRMLCSDIAQRIDGNEAQINQETSVLSTIQEEYQKRVHANQFGQVLSDVDKLFARKDVAKTKWRINDAKHFLREAIAKTHFELTKDRQLKNKSSEYREFHVIRTKTLTILKDFYQSQLDLVEQTEKIFYSSWMKSKDCPQSELTKLQKTYGKYSHYSTSMAELKKLAELNSRMLNKSKSMIEQVKTSENAK